MSTNEGAATDALHLPGRHDGADPPPGRPPRRGRSMRRVVVLLTALGLVVGATVLALAVLVPFARGFGGSGDYPGPGTGSVTVTIREGDSGRAMGATLERAGVVKSARTFVDAFTADPKSAGIQPGDYAMRREMPAAAALAVLTDPSNRRVPTVTIREGLFATEVYAELSRATGHPVGDYEAAAKDPMALGLPAAAKGNVEGYLFPAKYEISPTSTPLEQLRLMVVRASNELTRLGVSGEAAHRLVVVGSLVEAEGRRAQDRPKIARVVENRLAQGWKLQLDSTVTYPVRNPKVTTTDAQRATPTPWNTYVVDGLPAAPIANPGASALQAAAAPEPGPWLYFVAVNPATGETAFATTADEHARNVAAFQAWCSANPGQC